MSDLFGAPSGIIASEQDIRRNVLTGMEAAKTLGEIEKQPAERALAEAHTRLYGAEADRAETAAANERMLIQLGNQLRANGVEPTAANMAPALNPASSAADPIFQLANAAREKGMSPTVWAPLLEKGVTIQQHEASTLSAQTQALENQMKAQKEVRAQIGAVASGAAQSPVAFATAVMDPQNRKLLPPGIEQLPFEQAKPILEAISQQMIEADKKAELALRKQEAEARDKRVAVEQSKAKAYVDYKRVQQETAEETLNLMRKYDGDKSGSAHDARESLAKTRAELRDARDRKEFPDLPFDDKTWKEDHTYYSNGRRIIVKKKSDGTLGLFELPKSRNPNPARDAAISRGLAITNAPEETP